MHTRAFLSDKPGLYSKYQRALRSGVDRLVGVDTEVCIEGPPGSGNSFFFAGFRMANPDVRIAHHHHTAAQVIRALELGVPTVALLRNPVDCVLSRVAMKEARSAIGPNLRLWIAFWGAIESVRRAGLIVSFAAMTADPSAAVRYLNKYYGTTFVDDFPQRAAVFAQLDRERLERFGADPSPNPNRPDGRKAELQARMRPAVERHKLARRATELFRSIEPDI